VIDPRDRNAITCHRQCDATVSDALLENALVPHRERAVVADVVVLPVVGLRVIERIVEVGACAGLELAVATNQ
jgi:hypothetical protein